MREPLWGRADCRAAHEPFCAGGPPVKIKTGPARVKEYDPHRDEDSPQNDLYRLDGAHTLRRGVLHQREAQRGGSSHGGPSDEHRIH